MLVERITEQTRSSAKFSTMLLWSLQFFTVVSPTKYQIKVIFSQHEEAEKNLKGWIHFDLKVFS